MMDAVCEDYLECVGNVPRVKSVTFALCVTSQTNMICRTSFTDSPLRVQRGKHYIYIAEDRLQI